MPFSKELSVGNRAIDSAHKEVFGMIDRIARPIMARDVTALSEAFDLLENCLCVYFSVEENIAQALDFDFTKHKLAHQDLLKIFQRIKDELTAVDNRSSEFEKKDCISYLRDCLIRHIKEDGEPLKMVLDTHFYDFNP